MTASDLAKVYARHTQRRCLCSAAAARVHSQTRVPGAVLSFTMWLHERKSNREIAGGGQCNFEVLCRGTCFRRAILHHHLCSHMSQRYRAKCQHKLYYPQSSARANPPAGLGSRTCRGRGAGSQQRPQRPQSPACRRPSHSRPQSASRAAVHALRRQCASFGNGYVTDTITRHLHRSSASSHVTGGICGSSSAYGVRQGLQMSMQLATNRLLYWK